MDYQTRPPSSAADVAAVCRQIVSGSSLVRLSGIDWRVLEVTSDDRALLLADRVIGTGPYHEVGERCDLRRWLDKWFLFLQTFNTGRYHVSGVTWERCDLRRWLNDDFCGSLGEPLTSRVLRTKVKNKRNRVWGTPGGMGTTDLFFLLSIEEACLDLAGQKSVDWKKIKKTWLPLGQQGKAVDEKGESAWWWLRSSGAYPDRAARVGTVGNLDGYGSVVSASSGGVRPAFWLNLES
ncbi:MAG: DUF6273 domain-containing protein [Cellulomonas sp.]|nr:DUF6273 domain-containing protein [Cellulomonas sp.]